MSSQIVISDAAAPADPNSFLNIRHENTVQTPIISAALPVNGTSAAGVYTLTGASGSTIDITAEDPKNELVGTGISVVADGTTVNDLGFALVVISGSLAVGWTGKIAIGSLMATDGSTSKRLDAGVIESGLNDTQRRVTAVNVGSQTSSSTKVYGLPGFIGSGAGYSTIITGLKNHTDENRHALAVAGLLDVTFSDFKTGPPQTADVLVGGVKAIEDAILDGRFYQYGVAGYINAADLFRGIAIAFALDPGDPTALNPQISVRDSSEWIQFAPDVTGAPGTWQAGELVLTQIGQPTGVIQPAGQVNFWRRLVVPSSAGPGDMRHHRYRVRGLTV